MMLDVILFLLTTFFFSSVHSSSTTNVTVIKIGALYPMSGGWNEGIRVSVAVRMALDDINNSTILPSGYRMEVVSADDKCSALAGISAILPMFTEAQSSGIPLAGLLLGGCSIVCQPVAQIGAVWKLPQLSWGCSSPALSSKATYPFFTRTDPSDALQAYPIFEIVRHYGWRRVASIHQQEDLFTQQQSIFARLCNKTGIDIISAQSFATGTTFEPQLQAIKASGAKVIIFATYGDTARDIFFLAKKLGLHEKGYVWIGNGWYGDGFYRGSPYGSDLEMGLAASDVLGVQGDLGSGPIYDALNARYIEKYETPELRALDFSGIGWGTYAYDGMVAMARAYGAAIRAGRNIHDGDYVLAQLKAVNFTGISGPVAFDANGDRNAPYTVLNFRMTASASDTAEANFGWVPVGRYDPNKGLELRPTSTVYFSGHVTEVPLDRDPEPILPIFQLSPVIQKLVYALVAIILSIQFILAVTLTWARNTVRVRAASYPVSLFILAAAVIMTTGAIFYVLDPGTYPFVCHARPWFTCLSLIGILSALAAKTNRIRMIFTNRILSDRVQRNSDLFLIISVVMCFQLALLIGSSTSSLSIHELIVGSKGTQGYLVNQCTSMTYHTTITTVYQAIEHTNFHFIAWFIVQGLYVMCFLLGVTYIAWRIRAVPSVFNEASRMLTCLFILCVFCFILVPINFLVDDNPNALMVIRGIGQCLGSLTLCAALFGPIVYSIATGRSNENPQNYNPTTLHNKKGGRNSTSGEGSGHASSGQQHGVKSTTRDRDSISVLNPQGKQRKGSLEHVAPLQRTHSDASSKDNALEKLIANSMQQINAVDKRDTNHALRIYEDIFTQITQWYHSTVNAPSNSRSPDPRLASSASSSFSIPPSQPLPLLRSSSSSMSMSTATSTFIPIRRELHSPKQESNQSTRLSGSPRQQLSMYPTTAHTYTTPDPQSPHAYAIPDSQSPLDVPTDTTPEVTTNQVQLDVVQDPTARKRNFI